MKFDVITLFPPMFQGPLTESIIKRGAEKGLLSIRLHNLRDYALDRHHTTDDAPYGGGAGMVMKVEPLDLAITQVKAERPAAKVILTTPRGVPFDQKVAERLAQESELIIVCGRYEGVDERVSELFVDEEISLGDFVLTGGELAAMAIIDAVSRLLPGVLGSEESAIDDSFASGLLEYPQYTRPAEFNGCKVPEVLLSGNHQEIAIWRRREALRRTRKMRPELLRSAGLTAEDMKYLESMDEAEGR
jgi:tRNA (guanine37-N1)-methyltransferase